ncbi:hypothetical protein [uncultured Methanospirillum sp.]|uniref:hypothetical protein n=1 Tax=uncultured Methanospirillum sp. TaxID=262503 RepID=UPI0029C64737|nr:hypothetical protein [uncultured Methanospirillum sp.]
MNLRENSGLIIFGVLVIVVVLAAFIALEATGTMGIEDRYNQAVGLPAGEEETEGGFSLEGNPLMYLGILGALIAVSLILHRYLVKV